MFRFERLRGLPPYVVRIQYFALNLNGVTTGIYTLPIPVDPTRSFILWNGFAGPTTAPQRLCGTLVLTNATTITATRGSATGQITYYGCVVHCSPRLVRSIQTGIVALSAAATGTATLANAVDVTKSIVVYNGNTNNQGGVPWAVALAAVSLTNSTTVTADAPVATITGNVAFTVIEFEPTAVVRVLEINQTVADGTTSIAVNLAPSWPMNTTVSFYRGIFGTSSAAENTFQRGALTAADTFTISRVSTSASSRTYRATLVEFEPTVLRKLSRGTVALAAATSVNATIDEMQKEKTLLTFLGNDAAVGETNDQTTTGIVFSDATTVQAFVNTATTHNASYEAIVFN